MLFVGDEIGIPEEGSNLFILFFNVFIVDPSNCST